MCTAKLKFPVIILANESNVHCKIEIFSHHFCPLRSLDIYLTENEEKIGLEVSWGLWQNLEKP